MTLLGYMEKEVLKMKTVALLKGWANPIGWPCGGSSICQWGHREHSMIRGDWKGEAMGRWALWGLSCSSSRAVPGQWKGSICWEKMSGLEKKKRTNQDDHPKWVGQFKFRKIILLPGLMISRGKVDLSSLFLPGSCRSRKESCKASDLWEQQKMWLSPPRGRFRICSHMFLGAKFSSVMPDFLFCGLITMLFSVCWSDRWQIYISLGCKRERLKAIKPKMN